MFTCARIIFLISLLLKNLESICAIDSLCLKYYKISSIPTYHSLIILCIYLLFKTQLASCNDHYQLHTLLLEGNLMQAGLDNMRSIADTHKGT